MDGSTLHTAWEVHRDKALTTIYRIHLAQASMYSWDPLSDGHTTGRSISLDCHHIPCVTPRLASRQLKTA